MSDIVRKLMVNNMMEMGKVENWLHHLSMEGIHLKKLGSLFSTFEKGSSRNINYRIDILEKKKRKDKIDFHENRGWVLISNLNDFHVFSSDKNNELLELYENPKDQMESVMSLYSKMKINFIIGVISLLVFLGLMVALISIDNFYLNMVEGYIINQLLLLIFQMYIFFSIFKNYFIIRKLKKTISEGNRINHNEPYNKNRIGLIVFYSLYFPMLIMLVCLPFIKIAKDKEYMLPYEKDQLPAVRLYDIEKNKDLVREKGTSKSDIDFLNRVNHTWSLISPNQYEVDEHAEIGSLMWNDGSGIYSPSIHTEFYELRFSFISEKLLEDLIERYVWREDISVVNKNSEYFDSLYIAEKEEEKKMFASKDNYVISVRYYGYGNLDELEDQIVYEMKRYIK